MRTTAFLISLVTALVAQAQSSTVKTIMLPEVEVRGGPSPEFCATTRLKQGDRVQVVGSGPRMTGWLAIKPTRMDFSWVNVRFVEQNGSTAIVKNPEGASLWVGRRPVQQSPTEHHVDVKQGTLLSVLDRPWTAPDGTTWLPIAPYQSEVRYIPEGAVNPRPPIETTLASAPPQNVATTRPTALSSRVDQLFDQAEKADQTGAFDGAIQLYQQVARATQDESQRIRVLNRAQYLRNRLATHAQRLPDSRQRRPQLVGR